MFDHKRKARLGSAKKYVTGHEVAAFNKLFSMLHEVDPASFPVGDYTFTYVFSELQVPGKKELEVIEDVPDAIDSLYSMSFDVVYDVKKAVETIFYRDEVATIPTLSEKETEELMIALLGNESKS